MSEPFTIPGEGEAKLVERTRVRIECVGCGEPATRRHTYLLPNARGNPASSAYGKDDCSWCSDHEVFTCADCHGGRAPTVEGYGWCSTFTLQPGSSRFAHMFLTWVERPLSPTAAAVPSTLPPVADGAGRGEF
jgi:hypothetical protein